MFAAVKSLGLLVWRGATPYVVGANVDGEPGVSLCATLGSGRPYGAGSCVEISGGTPLPLWGWWGEGPGVVARSLLDGLAA